MKLHFVSANLHGAGDYAAASALIAAPFNLETAVGQVRVCVFLAFWQGA